MMAPKGAEIDIAIITFKIVIDFLTLNKGCNKRIFSLKPWKKFGADPFYRFREKLKNAPLISKNNITDPKARLL